MELHTEGINDSNLGYILSFDTFQYENGTATTLGEGDNKLVDTICTGVCATGSSTESVINATCKELESGPEWVNDKEEILTETMVNTTWEEECQTCENFPDKSDRFNWTCTLKVSRITRQCRTSARLTYCMSGRISLGASGLMYIQALMLFTF